MAPKLNAFSGAPAAARSTQQDVVSPIPAPATFGHAFARGQAAHSANAFASGAFAAPQPTLQPCLPQVAPALLVTQAEPPKASIWSRLKAEAVDADDTVTTIASQWVRPESAAPAAAIRAPATVPPERTSSPAAVLATNPAGQSDAAQSDAARAMRDAARDRRLREADRAQQESEEREVDRQRRLEHVDAAIAATVVGETEQRRTCAALETGALSAPLHGTTARVPVTFSEEAAATDWASLVRARCLWLMLFRTRWRSWQCCQDRLVGRACMSWAAGL